MNAEILGYFAMVLVGISFLLKDVVKLRLVNAAGAICFVIYGFLIDSNPVIGLNLFVAGVNAYYIWKSRNQRPQ
ncbi:inner membrane protein [Nicoletella semolina]|uniref:Inner membrane protein n=1 Tax=Nicoletella semolina TaxID=271160 RepID=A0A4R2N8P8_9PAST|nr:YgjV family protein [Nicoletella semolina]MDH2924520.1 lactate dehydrogenase [Nicoletella semolina]TCP17352.1 inner membrane protein [Nicoletella semolina]